MADSALTYRRRFNLRIPFVPFSLDSAGGTQLKQLNSVPRKILFGTPNVPGFSQVIKLCHC